MADLTARELQVLRLVAEGHSDRSAAKAIGLAPGTVQNTLCRVKARLGVRSRAHAVHLAHLQGLLGEASDE